jgi:hypothetical protein
MWLQFSIEKNKNASRLLCGKWNVNGETATRNRRAGEGLRTKNDSEAEFIMGESEPEHQS